MKGSITADSIANSVRMLRTQHSGAFMIVEGPTDKTFFSQMIDAEACVIVISHGKHNALRAVSILEADCFLGVVAVLDTDYQKLDGDETLRRSGNVLLTDYHDVECMLVASPAFDKVLAEFANADRVAKFSQRHGGVMGIALATKAMPLGYLRWFSLRKNLALRFEELSFGRFVDHEDLSVNIQLMVRAVKDHSQRHDLADEFLEDNLSQIHSEQHDPWQVSCGHDIISLLTLGLRKTFASRDAKDVTTEVIERSLRLAYSIADFTQTGLYKEMRRWEIENLPFRLLPESA